MTIQQLNNISFYSYNIVDNIFYVIFRNKRATILSGVASPHIVKMTASLLTISDVIVTSLIQRQGDADSDNNDVAEATTAAYGPSVVDRPTSMLNIRC